ncbi:trypsin-like peptidase domain-containing protein [Streptomyces nigrescens]|uniref:trypsin-like peptidase domain-containing protein n=1 Tax=Streptomyces nigrescens TaxID=1920 RepID=UPI0036FD0960
MHPVSADDSLRTAFVSFLKSDGTVAGGGVLVSDDGGNVSVLTCAHVVNMALGRHQFAAEKPTSDRVTVAFPSAPGQRAPAGVIGWWPARSLREKEGMVAGTEQRWRGDIALLNVTDDLPEPVQPVRLAAPRLGQSAWTWFGSGEPTSVVRVQVSAVADEWLVLGGAPTGHAVQPGYSGSPLWDREMQAVVGILVSAHHAMPYSRMSTADIIRQSYAIRADSIAEHCLTQSREPQPVPGDVQALLNAQRSAARAFPYRAVGLHGRDPSTVYVRQQVSTSVNAAAALAADPEQRINAPDSGSLKPKTIEEALATHRHLFLTGVAGSGKSTLTLQLATRAVVLPGVGATTLVPVRLLARDLAARPGMRLLSAASEAVRASLARFLSHELDPQLLERRVPGSRWLLVIDGLDEVTARADRADLIERVRVFMEGEREYQVLITSRPLPAAERRTWDSEKDLTHYAIEPFQHHQRAQFAHAWFADDAQLAELFLRELAAARFEEEASIPLLATVSAVVFSEDPSQPLPASRFDLYERYFSHLYDSRARQLLHDTRARLAGRPMAEELARRLVEARVTLVEHLAPLALRAQSLLAEALRWLADRGITPTPAPPDWSEIVSSVLTSTGLLVPDGEGLAFAHHTFAEHICDLIDARRLPSRFDPDDLMWWRTLSLACTGGNVAEQRMILHRALLDNDAAELLDWLLAGNDTARELAAALMSRGVRATSGQQAALARSFDFWLWRAARDSNGPYVHQVVSALGLLRSLGHPLQRVIYDAAENTALPDVVREAAVHALLRSGEPHSSRGLALLRCFVNDQQLAGAVRIRAVQALEFTGATRIARDSLIFLTQDLPSLHEHHRSTAEELLNGARSWTSLPDRPAAGPSPIDVRPIPADLSVEENYAGDMSTPGEYRLSRRDMDDMVLRSGGRSSMDLPMDIHALLSLSPTADVEAVAAGAVGEVAAEVSRTLRGQTVHRSHAHAEAAWSRLARWLCSRPAPSHSPHAATVIRLLEDIAEHQHRVDGPNRPLVAQPQRAVLAALLLRAQPEHWLAGLRLLTGPMVLWDFGVVEYLLQVTALRGPDFRKQVVAQYCRILLDSRLPHRCRQGIVTSVRNVDADAAAAFLTQSHEADPYMVTMNVLWLGRQYRAEAVGYVQRKALRSLDGVLKSWCRAAGELLATGSRADREETARMLKEIALRANNATEALAVTEVLAMHNGPEAARCAGHIAGSTETSDADRMAAAGLLARLGGGPEYESVVLGVLDQLGGARPPKEAVAFASQIARISPTVRARSEQFLRTCLEPGPDGLPAQLVVAELARLGPSARAQLCRNIERVVSTGPLGRKAWFGHLEAMALLGPDLHEAIQNLLASCVRSPGSTADRLGAADLISNLDWQGSGAQAAALLSSLTDTESEHPAIRALAARRLHRYGPQHSAIVLRTLLALASKVPALPPLLAIQIARELASAGAVEHARHLLSALACNRALPESDRVEAALLLLFLDPSCSVDTTQTLATMAHDRRLSADTRRWATSAPSVLAKQNRAAISGAPDLPLPQGPRITP